MRNPVFPVELERLYMHPWKRWPVAAPWAAVILLAAVLTASSVEAQELYTAEQAERGLSVFRIGRLQADG